MSFPDFLNPYAFVPIPVCPESGARTIPGVIAREAVDTGKDHVTHDRFVAGDDIFTGRILCRLTVEELLLVGGKQEKGDKLAKRPRKVTPFQLPDGTWALPATSLKGMISSVLEAATGSTLRVLSNRAPSQSRKAAADAKDMSKSDPRQYSLSENRGRVHLNYPHTYFRTLSPHLVPLEPGDTRSFVTLAEALFGYVEGSQTGSGKSDAFAAALAGRVRFSFARLTGNPPTLVKGLTQILDGPKPPSPSMYFRPKNRPAGAHIPRTGVNSAEHVPKGRKFYLHRQNLEVTDWQTRDPRDQAHQKADITAIGAGAVFEFSIAFTNLSRIELEALVWALTPADAFRHKLGMGRPLGMGKVRIEPIAVLRSQPAQRYGEDDFSASRWHTAWTAQGSESLAENSTADPAIAPSALRDAFDRRIATKWPALDDSLAAIRLLGDPAKVTAPVHYPQPSHRTRTKEQRLRNDPPVSIEPDSAQMERNSYEWFVNNDHAAAQHLGTIGAQSASLPTLRRNAEHQGGGSHGGGTRPNPDRPVLQPEQLRHTAQREQVETANATRSDQLVGGIHTFYIAEFKKGKPRFRCTNDQIGLDGSISDIGELAGLDLDKLKAILASGTTREHPMRFLVKSIANASFQLALPPES